MSDCSDPLFKCSSEAKRLGRSLGKEAVLQNATEPVFLGCPQILPHRDLLGFVFLAATSNIHACL